VPNKSTCCFALVVTFQRGHVGVFPSPLLSHVLPGDARKGIVEEQINKLKSSKKRKKKDIMNLVQHIFLDQSCL